MTFVEERRAPATDRLADELLRRHGNRQHRERRAQVASRQSIRPVVVVIVTDRSGLSLTLTPRDVLEARQRSQ